MSARGERFAIVRAAEAVLLAAMLLGALALWTAVPAAALWGVGRIVTDPVEHLLAGLLAVPTAMTAFGLCLAWLNTLYLRLASASPVGELGWRPRLGGPLDGILTFSAALAIAGFAAWRVFGSAGTLPGMT